MQAQHLLGTNKSLDYGCVNVDSCLGDKNILAGDLLATEFATASTNYEQLDAMFQSVKELQPSRGGGV